MLARSAGPQHARGGPCGVAAGAAELAVGRGCVASEDASVHGRGRRFSSARRSASAASTASLYLVDDRGAVIDEYGPNYADLDLPIIDGLSSAPGEEASDVYRAMLARRLLDALRVRNMASQISQIDVSDSRNAVVLLEGDPTFIRLGNERFVERLQSYHELAPALREHVPAIDYVDLRFDERVYVRPARERRRRRRQQGGAGKERARPTQTG